MERFGRYVLVRKVGQGGMAEIWEARTDGPAGFQKTLAIKVILPELVEDSSFVEMFLDEARLVADLVHPNVVQVFELGQAGPQDYFIAMEYVSGANLSRFLSRHRASGQPMPPEVAAYVAIELCKGLGYAHARTDAAGKPMGIVHRDVSPHNVLISFGGDVKISDFGIARVATAVRHTAAGHVRGKLGYMSPEQAGSLPLDGRSDLFSVGVILLEMLSGHRLFQAEDPPALYAKVVRFPGLTAEELAPLPPSLQSVVKTALDPSMQHRFQNALQMESALTSAFPSGQVIVGRQVLASMMDSYFAMPGELGLVTPAAREGSGSPGRGSPEPLPAQRESMRGEAPTILSPHLSSVDGMAVREEVPTIVKASPPTGLTLATQAPVVQSSSVPALPATGSRLIKTLAAAAAAALMLLIAGVLLRQGSTSGSGQLNVNASQPCEVWLDGKRIAAETPLRVYPIPAGRHRLRVANALTGAGADQEIDVADGALLSAQVNVEAGTMIIKH